MSADNGVFNGHVPGEGAMDDAEEVFAVAWDRTVLPDMPEVFVHPSGYQGLAFKDTETAILMLDWLLEYVKQP